MFNRLRTGCVGYLHPWQRLNKMGILSAILGFLTALIPILGRIFPQKTVGEKIKDRIAGIHESEKKYEETGDTTDLGRLP